MRTVLAAAAAGALIMGSAAGAMADESTPAVVAPVPVVKIQKVDIHRHNPINITKPRPIKVRVTVRATNVASVTAATVEMGQYLNKRQVAPSSAFTALATLTERTVKGNEVRFKGTIAPASLAGLGLAAGQSTTLCINDVDLTVNGAEFVETGADMSVQTKKRLAAPGVKNPVRECIKVYYPKAKPAKNS